MAIWDLLDLLPLTQYLNPKHEPEPEPEPEPDGLVFLASRYPGLWILFVLSGIIGASYILRFVLRIGIILLQTFLIKGKSLKTYGAKKGAWAVITGATDGIGREFAMQLGKAGFNVFLASRSSEKLDTLASEIEAQYGVQAKTQAIDFSKPGHSAWGPFEDALRPLEIGILVNNVGKSHDIPTDFVEAPQDEINDILQVNIISTLKTTSVVLPGMISRKCGLVLNISSFSGGLIATPMLATYAGSKAFLSTWSQAVAREVRSKGVTVVTLNTAFVVSKMSKIRRPSLFTPTAKPYVQSVLSKIGVPGGALGQPYTSTPYWSHSLVNAFMNELNWPSFWIDYTLDLHRGIRKRALRKRDKDASSKKE